MDELVKTVGHPPSRACQHCGDRLPLDGGVWVDFTPYCSRSCAEAHTRRALPQGDKHGSHG